MMARRNCEFENKLRKFFITGAEGTPLSEVSGYMLASKFKSKSAL